MIYRKTIHPSYVAVRKHPVNLAAADVPLFEREFSREINATAVVEFKNGNILKGTIFSLRQFKFYKSLSHIFPVPDKKLYKRLLKFFLPYHRIDTGIWISDEWSPEYFHWLTDALPRLITVDDHVGRYTVILPAFFKERSYIRQSLELLGFEVYDYDFKKRLLVNRLITATHTALSGNYNHTVINQLRKRFLTAETAVPHKKIFISRERAAKRRITNETAVAALLVEHGFERHYFEDYDLKKQVSLMRESQCLIGLHGAGLTNMLFMPAGGKVLELRNENDTHNNCYFTLASELDHQYYYLINKGDNADTNKVDITVDLERLQEVIALFG